MRKLIAAAIVVVAVTAVAPLHAEADVFSLASAIGSPDEDVSGVRDAGVVHLLPIGVTHGSVDPQEALTVTRATLGGTPRAGDRFGAAVLMVGINADTFLDLVISAPGADHGAGRVYVILFVSPGRFDFEHPIVLQQGRDGLLGTNEAGDGFGEALDFVDFDGRLRYLVVGAPGEDVHAVRDAGAVTVIGDFTNTGADAVYYQGSGLPGTAERGDRFGATLARIDDGVVVGAPGEDVRSVVDAGNITSFAPPVPGSGNEYHAGDGDVPGSAEAGDRFGAALQARWCTVSVGVPGEDIGDVRDAGEVVDLPAGCGGRATRWYQGYNGLGGRPEAGDRFGAALAAVSGALAVGVPGEDVGGVVDVGQVQVLGETGGYVTLTASRNRAYDQDSADVPEAGEAGDQMGAALSNVGSTWSLAVGVPQEDVGAVADAGSTILLGFEEENEELVLMAPNTRVLTQDDLGSAAEDGDRFGSVVA